MSQSPVRQIAHVDLDAFFASVECLLNPDLAGRPLIVGGSPEGRGVVAAASYEARAFGIHSAMPVAHAVRLCPQVARVPARHGVYGEHSRHVMAILASYTPVIERISIDEAYLDLTGTERLWGPTPELAHQIQRRVRDECGLPCSLGVATSKLVAKIACSQGKPRGVVVVPPGEEKAFLSPLPIEALWGVGEATAARLRTVRVRTVGDLAAMPKDLCVKLLGDASLHLWRLAQGIDDSPVSSGHDRRSISKEHTFGRDTADPERLQRMLLAMSDQVTARLREETLVAQTVRIKLRYGDFETLTRQETLAQPTDQPAVVYACAKELLDTHWDRRRPLRLVGLGVSGLLSEGGYQLDLFDHSDQRRVRLHRTLDEIHERFGRDAITRASLIDRHEGSDHKAS